MIARHEFIALKVKTHFKTMAAIESIANLKLNDTVPQCPFADPENPSPYESSVIRCPFHKIKHILPEDPSRISQAVPVRISNGTFTKSGSSAQLLRDIGGGKRIREMTTRFYAHAFKDYTLDPFMFMGDGAERHGQRLGDWIIEKMGGEGEPWTNSGR